MKSTSAATALRGLAVPCNSGEIMNGTSHISHHTVKPLGSVLAAVVVATVIAGTPMTATAQNQPAAAPKIPTVADAIDPVQAAEQARELGLTAAEAAALQKRVDELIVETGGVQIAANKVLWADASRSTCVPPKRGMSCPCPVGALCTYTKEAFRGEMTAWFKCVYHNGLTPYKWASYVNNQTGGARAHFGDLPGPGGYWVATPRAFSANRFSTNLVFATEIRPCSP